MKDKQLVPSNDEIVKWNKEWAELNQTKIKNFANLLTDHDVFLCKKAANWTKKALQYRETNPFITGGRDID